MSYQSLRRAAATASSTIRRSSAPYSGPSIWPRLVSGCHEEHELFGIRLFSASMTQATWAELELPELDTKPKPGKVSDGRQIATEETTLITAIL
ncbi:hypothetical protein Q1695_009794 [Nippostrongylus brasiliensis]|nr:hypothetical protein Q1695_009794 [Nippostrongylus brasiliensis]